MVDIMPINASILGFLNRWYSKEVAPTGPVSFGTVQLKKSMNNLVIEIVGKESRADGYSNGYLVKVDVWQVSRE